VPCTVPSARTTTPRSTTRGWRLRARRSAAPRVPRLRRAVHHVRDGRTRDAAGGEKNERRGAVRREQASQRPAQGAGEAARSAANRWKRRWGHITRKLRSSASVKSPRGRSARS
jgi:hypothetical protein